jgi:hypothetical protein
VCSSARASALSSRRSSALRCRASSTLLCRANLFVARSLGTSNSEHMSQSSPDSGTGSSHFQCDSLETHVRWSRPVWRACGSVRQGAAQPSPPSPQTATHNPHEESSRGGGWERERERERDRERDRDWSALLSRRCSTLSSSSLLLSSPELSDSQVHEP